MTDRKEENFWDIERSQKGVFGRQSSLWLSVGCYCESLELANSMLLAYTENPHNADGSFRVVHIHKVTTVDNQPPPLP